VQLFKACEALGGCIIFLDELDSLASSRDRADMHEASRRLLGVLLREVDGFDNSNVDASSSGSSSNGQLQQQQQQRGAANRRSVLIGATNRRQDLDAALLSRCVSICPWHVVLLATAVCWVGVLRRQTHTAAMTSGTSCAQPAANTAHLSVLSSHCVQPFAVLSQLCAAIPSLHYVVVNDAHTTAAG
jgi:hypothetical protein